MKALLYKELKNELLPYIFTNIVFIIVTIFFSNRKFLEIALIIVPMSNLIRSFANDDNSKFEKGALICNDRKSLVISKYLMFFIYIGIGVISIVITHLIVGNNILSYLSPLVVIMFTGFFVIPTYFKFGKKYIFIIGGLAYAFSLISFMLLPRLLIENVKIFSRWYYKEVYMVYLIFFVINLITFLISLSVSLKVVKNRDF